MQRILNTLFSVQRPKLPHMSPTLQFLDFDFSEDAEGLGSWSALASPADTYKTALLAEVQALIQDLNTRLGTPGPVDDGYAWDMALDVKNEGHRITVSLDISGFGALRDCMERWRSC